MYAIKFIFYLCYTDRLSLFSVSWKSFIIWWCVSKAPVESIIKIPCMGQLIFQEVCSENESREMGDTENIS